VAGTIALSISTFYDVQYGVFFVVYPLMLMSLHRLAKIIRRVDDIAVRGKDVRQGINRHSATSSPDGSAQTVRIAVAGTIALSISTFYDVQYGVFFVVYPLMLMSRRYAPSGENHSPCRRYCRAG
jgi:hypothetical protein